MQTNIPMTDLLEPKESEIRAQLVQILENAEFKRSPKIARFLEYVVEETLDGKQQYLKGHTIAIEVFDKDQSFDPQIDPLVRVNAVRLRRMLHQYYSTDGLNDDVMIDIIKGSYVPQIYYTKNSDKITDDQPILSKNSSFPCIAVLNFKNLSGNFSYGYFVDGITQEILSQLCKFKELIVVASSSINLNEDQYISTKRLREVIDVCYVLSGSVRIEDDNVCINVELDDTTTHTIVWVNEYKKKLSVSNMISIQDEIATHVAISIAQPYGIIIRKELAKLHRTSTNDLTAYQLFLHFYQWCLTLSTKDHLKARDALERAVKIDPTFSDAWAALAIIYNTEYQLSCNLVKRDQDVRDLAFETARKSIKSDPENARAHYALIFANMVKFGTRACLDEAEKAYQLHPHNPLLIAIYGTRLALCGEWEYGLELVEHAIVLNPSHPDFYHLPFVINYYRREMYPEALQEARKIHMPDFFWTNLMLAALHTDMGEEKHARSAAKKLIEIYPKFEQQARFEFEKWDMQTELIEKLLNGLRKAGLQIT